ncbi:carbohydrate binding family 9 domain-containing protein [Flavobacterium piscinae]|uniref:carbohydrate binding family 9 domain-containing protein n=1 Tax=Flavobacterium piscinae TaxID=2506424 RepID=UPI002AABE5C2|nr:carbohydrate binding family 9 domain-containing protein [Flavobacterium piscinae]
MNSIRPLFSIILFLLIGTFQVYSQKKTTAFRVNESISIDGKLNETVWKKTSIANNFIMLEPENGVPESTERKSEVRILYDDNAIYVGAILYDNEPSKIEKEITQRDNFGTADHFGIFINGFNDGQQDFRFFVSASGVQMDCLATENGEDFSWDAIWNSEVKITDYGWVIEMEIPYAKTTLFKRKCSNLGC